eukprot:2598361-Karenia_brevis.AAC.1
MLQEQFKVGDRVLAGWRDEWHPRRIVRFLFTKSKADDPRYWVQCDSDPPVHLTKTIRGKEL